MLPDEGLGGRLEMLISILRWFTGSQPRTLQRRFTTHSRLA